MIAEIIINSTVKNLDRTFDYNIPDEYIDQIKIGNRVLVPFGRMKSLEEGIVVGFKEKSEFKVKDIAKIQEGISLTEDNIELAKLMSKRYFASIFDCIKLMLPPGTTSKIINNRVKEKSMTAAYLAKDESEIEADIEQGKIKSDKQIRVLKFLCDNDGSLISEIETFTDATRAVVKTLEKNGYVELLDKKIERNPFINKNVVATKSLILTKEQQEAFDKIKIYMDLGEYEQFLIFGVTGSGKTEIYMQLIAEAVEKGQTAIMLVPEISLTPQMVDRFISRFGEKIIAVLHSKLSVGERYDQWNKIKNGEAKIVIGPRSALFAPVKNLGLIIIDEEHDNSYKSEMSPRYNAKEVANYIAKKNNIPLILGSATPDIRSYYAAEHGKMVKFELTKRANDSKLPDVEIVDLRQELAKGNRTMFSDSLHQAIEENIKNKKQTILFLNRRGYSTFVMCRDCGYVVKCKNCDITMTYRLRLNRLKCHYCGYEQNNITICPECHSKNIKYFGTGTQKLEEEVHKTFPGVTTIRMDIDTVTKKNSHEEILNKFKNDNIDILIGTQMVVKGHHFPNVTLVGVVFADSGIFNEDYRANERTFQTLTQVAGRAGREKNSSGKVIIQTYNPDNFSVQCAKEQNYIKFYNTELFIRKNLKYPPFYDIIVIGINGIDEIEVKKVASEIFTNITHKINDKIGIILYKPMPAPIDRIKNRFRWRIILKCNLNSEILDIVNSSINIKLNNDKNNSKNNTRIVVDINPTNMM